MHFHIDESEQTLNVLKKSKISMIH